MPKLPISREEVLGGLLGGRSIRQANSVFLMIEARTAQLVAEQRSVNTPFMTAAAREERNLIYLQAIAASEAPPRRPTIQDYERMAVRCADLVPDNPAVRAALAKKFGEEFSFTKQRVPRLAAVLGLADDEVISAFDRQYGVPLESIFAADTPALEQARWMWLRINEWLEGLSPFWTAFALTVTETIGAGTLALPIALATVGPLAAAVLLLLLGLFNLATVGFMAEASARDGALRYGSSFVGQLVGNFLGPFANLVLRLCLFFYCCAVLVAFYTGFSATLGEVSGLPDPIWIAVIFAAGVFLIVRKTLIGTVASALLIGFVNISILILLSFVALAYARWDNLTNVTAVPFIGEGFDISVLQLVFGVAMVSYFGHLSISNCAQAVLRREPDGRSLKRGTMAATAVAIAVYALWCVAIGSAVEPDRLANEPGTALGPLAETIGPGVLVLGTIFVMLGLGMGSIHYSLGIFNMARELFAGRVGRKEAASLTASDLLQRSPAERRILTWLMRQDASGGPAAAAAEIAGALDLEEAEALVHLAALSRAGLVRGEDRGRGTVYVVVAALHRPGPQWSREPAAVFDKLSIGGKTARRQGRGDHLYAAARDQIVRWSKTLPNLTALAPVCLIFLYCVWAYFAGQQSFTKPLELVGVLLTPILAGLIPLLLLVASRRRGSAVSGARLPAIIANPIIFGIVAALSFASLILHGAVIWDEPISRLAAFAAAGVMVWIMVDLVHRDALAPALLVEIGQYAGDGGTARFHVSCHGEDMPVALTIGYGDKTLSVEPPFDRIEDFANCRSIGVDLPTMPAREIHVRADRVSVTFDREPMAGQVGIVTSGQERISYDFASTNGQIKAALPDGLSRLEFLFFEQET
ncbi:MAG: aromatic amino acid transport family protein [Pseudomonadota bacterium]